MSATKMTAYAEDAINLKIVTALAAAIEEASANDKSKSKKRNSSSSNSKLVLPELTPGKLNFLYCKMIASPPALFQASRLIDFHFTHVMVLQFQHVHHTDLISRLSLIH